MHWKTSLRVPSLALGQSYDCPSASEGTLKDVDNIDHYKSTTQQQSMNCIFLISIYHMRGPYPVKWNLLMMSTIITKHYIDGLMHERHTSNSIANSLELCLSCTNPSICNMTTTNLPNRSGWIHKRHPIPRLHRSSTVSILGKNTVLGYLHACSWDILYAGKMACILYSVRRVGKSCPPSKSAFLWSSPVMAKYL